jgi:hypothetical protein
MKIDVEGFEYQCMMGLHETIKRNKPTMVVECWGEEKFQAVWSILAELGYQYRFIDDERRCLLEDGDGMGRRPGNILFYADARELLGL